MAFTVIIKRKGLFANNSINVGGMLRNCGFKFGSYNDFYVLDEGKAQDNICILYNPAHLSRGIYFNGSDETQVELCFNVPTSKEEIDDFLALVKEICKQYKKYEIIDADNNDKYTLEELLNERDNLIRFSYDELKRILSKSNYGQQEWGITAARWPLFFDKEMVAGFKGVKDLSAFSKLLHEKQNIDAYYAKPSIARNKVDNTIAGIYTLTDECVSIFPTDANDYLMKENPQSPIQLDKGLIRFYIFSEKRPLNGLWDYGKFIKCVMNKGAVKYDRNHVMLPEYTKADIMDIINAIENMTETI